MTEEFGFSASIRHVAAKQLAAVDKHRAAAVAGDVDAVHDFRVAMRRMRSALRLLQGLPEPDAQAGKLRREARRYARAFDVVRDTDVLLGRIDTQLAARAVRRDASVVGWLLVLASERMNALGLAGRRLDGPRFSRWRRSVERWIATPDQSAEPIAQSLRRAVAQEASALRIAAANAKEPSEEAFHAVRIACKRVRYLVEFFRDSLGPKTQSWIKGFTSVQDALGDHRDLSAAHALATEAVERLKALGVRTTGTRRLAATFEAERNRIDEAKAVARAMRLVRDLERSLGPGS